MAVSPSDKNDQWTDSSYDSDSSLDYGTRSSEDELGFKRVTTTRGKVNTTSNAVAMWNSDCQTDLTGCVCYQQYYTGKSVVRHEDTLRVVVKATNLVKSKPSSYMLLDVECQTRSTGIVRLKEEVNELCLLPVAMVATTSSEERVSSSKGNIFDSNFRDTCNKSTLITLMCNALPTLNVKMLSVVSAVICDIVQSESNWNAAGENFEMHLNARSDVVFDNVISDVDTHIKMFDGNCCTEECKNNVDNRIEMSDASCSTDGDLNSIRIPNKLLKYDKHSLCNKTTQTPQNHTVQDKFDLCVEEVSLGFTPNKTLVDVGIQVQSLDFESLTDREFEETANTSGADISTEFKETANTSGADISTTAHFFRIICSLPLSQSFRVLVLFLSSMHVFNIIKDSVFGLLQYIKH